jgi:hypothetical protein
VISYFGKSWDTKLRETWLMTENEYAVLTTYVHDVAALNQKWAETQVHGLKE